MYRGQRFKRWHARHEREIRLGVGDIHRYEICYRHPLRGPYRFKRYPMKARYRKRWRKSKQWSARIKREWSLLKPVVAMGVEKNGEIMTDVIAAAEIGKQMA